MQSHPDSHRAGPVESPFPQKLPRPADSCLRARDRAFPGCEGSADFLFAATDGGAEFRFSAARTDDAKRAAAATTAREDQTHFAPRRKAVEDVRGMMQGLLRIRARFLERVHFFVTFSAEAKDCLPLRGLGWCFCSPILQRLRPSGQPFPNGGCLPETSGLPESGSTKPTGGIRCFRTWRIPARSADPETAGSGDR